jgi:hypothetical protein
MKRVSFAGSFGPMSPAAPQRFPTVPKPSVPTAFRCRSRTCGCRRQRAKPPAYAPTRPRDWPGRILWAIDGRSCTVAQLRGRLTGAFTDPGFDAALAGLVAPGAVPGLALVKMSTGQRVGRLVRTWLPFRKSRAAANLRVTSAVRHMNGEV